MDNQSEKTEDDKKMDGLLEAFAKETPSALALGVCQWIF